MGKISKEILKKHNKALEILNKENLDFYDIEYVFQHYHEGAGKMNNLISAHFTPYEIAHSIAHHVSTAFVDICAGIGMLSYAIKRYYQFNEEIPFGICVENCVEYYNVGKKLLPEFHWINGDIFDKHVIDEIKSLMGNRQFTVVSNPPYGKQVQADVKDFLHYSGSDFEYKAIELGAYLKAIYGVFLIPQNSCPFKYSGNKGLESTTNKEYSKFEGQTNLRIDMNIGFDTTIFNPDSEWPQWKDISIITEIAIVEYAELDYKPKVKKEDIQTNQLNLFE